MKTYYPADFMAAVLTHGKGFYSPLAYSLECRLLGIEFLSPDVNRPCVEIPQAMGKMPMPREPFDGITSFLPEPPSAIRVPISAIKGISQKLLSRLSEMKITTFASIADFADKTNSTESDLLLLLRSGAFDSLCSIRSDGIVNSPPY